MKKNFTKCHKVVWRLSLRSLGTRQTATPGEIIDPAIDKCRRPFSSSCLNESDRVVVLYVLSHCMQPYWASPLYSDWGLKSDCNDPCEDWFLHFVYWSLCFCIVYLIDFFTYFLSWHSPAAQQHVAQCKKVPDRLWQIARLAAFFAAVP